MTAPLYAFFVANERQAADELEEAGLATWVPTYKRLRTGADGARWKRHRHSPMQELPVCKGYVFARIPEGRMPDALACEQVRGVLSATGCLRGLPGPVPESDITRLLLLVTSGELDDHVIFTPGKPPRVLNKIRVRGKRRRAKRKIKRAA